MTRPDLCYLICKYNSIAILVASFVVSNVLADLFVSNLDPPCFHCICSVVGCDRQHGCSGGYCGPFQISPAYWEDAGKPVFPGFEKNKETFETCAKDYNCATTIIQGYVAKYARDCNMDGVTDCLDFVMMHTNGRYSCSKPLNKTPYGRSVLKLFNQCVL